MQCPRCGAITADDALDTRYCSNCGAILNETPGPTARATNQDAPSLLSAGSAPTMEAGWSEFSGATLAASTPPGAEPTYPSSSGFSYASPNAYPQMVPNDSMVPGAYSSPNLYPQQSVSGTYPPQVAPGGYPYAYAPGFMPPMPPAPKRRSPILAIVLSVLVILLVAGGVFAGLAIGLAHSKTATVQATVTTSPTATATPDAQQLYQQVTSQYPDFIDSLQNPTASRWAVFEKPTYGCEIKSDGLHLHIQDSGKYMDCTSDRGRFANFAFQVDMKILSGAGGGIVFREDSTAANLYYFHVYPDGGFHFYLSTNHQLTTELDSGNIDKFNSSQTNTLTVIAQGSRIYLYVNQKILSQVHDATYVSGFLGVLASDNNAPAEVVYTNMKIWIL